MDKKMLFLALDGVRSDSLFIASHCIKNLFLHNNTMYSTHVTINTIPVSGPSWSSILSGYKTSIYNNATVESVNYVYKNKTFLSQLIDMGYSSIFSVVSSWNGIYNIVKSSSKFCNMFDSYDDICNNDIEMTKSGINILKHEKNIDVLFMYFSDIDMTGHEYGFAPHIKEYTDAIKRVDHLVSNVLHCLDKRKKQFVNEDWLVVLTSDHGGTCWNSMSNNQKKEFESLFENKYIKKGVHGLDISSHNMSWLLCINDSFTNEEILPSPNITDIYNRVMNHFTCSKL